MTHNEEIHERIGVLKGLRIWWWAAAAILFGSSVVAFIAGEWVQGVCSLLWAGTSLLNLKSNSETIKNYEFGLDCTKEDLEHVSELQKRIREFHDKIRSCGIFTTPSNQKPIDNIDEFLKQGREKMQQYIDDLRKDNPTEPVIIEGRPFTPEDFQHLDELNEEMMKQNPPKPYQWKRMPHIYWEELYLNRPIF